MPPSVSNTSLWIDEDEGEYAPNGKMESPKLLFFPMVPGEIQIRNLWYMQRLDRPMIPAPADCPMPDKQKTAELKARVFSVYLRPWTLDRAVATAEVPFITDLDVVPAVSVQPFSAGHIHRRLRCKTSDVPLPTKRRLRGKSSDVCLAYGSFAHRSFADAWSWYVRGNVVSRTAARIITQFMAASCGVASHREEDGGLSEDDAAKADEALPDNILPLSRVHAILDRMSAGDCVKKQKAPQQDDVDACISDEDPDRAALQQSNNISDAMQLTAKLWSRKASEWQLQKLDTSTGPFGDPKADQDHKARSSHKKNKTAKPRDHQAHAYRRWKESSVQDWLCALATDKEPPTADMMKFLRRVADRCREEHRAFQRPAPATFDDEPVRDCLLGIPGAGKTACIKLMRRFFEECLQWEDGMHFQFLASQNTMAALLGGATLHSWGGIPVNLTDAMSKVHTKGADGDVDELYEKCLSMRWLVIDEISTVSTSLLGLLDSFLRRACMRHPYARCGRRQRPFGGVNIVFAGDFWQLPPVNANAIFCNPWRSNSYNSEEQKVLKMFWQPEHEDAIQMTFVLRESLRTTDKWLQVVLDADRHGEETWEMYCFTNGFPTRNPGSWLPGVDAPTCGTASCATLSKEMWPLMWERGQGTMDNWERRKELECHVCSAERQRRCCVLRAGNDADEDRFLADPFAAAPYVHPFRHPSYHATQLRALVFAKTAQKRLLWVTAYDKVVSNNLDVPQQREEQRKERWLEFHDRKTGGLPGLLPLVLDMPMRFTESVSKAARAMGVFKHTRCILRSVQLPEAESTRLGNIDAPEVVLKRRPAKLLLEVPTGTKLMPVIDGKRIFTLKVQSKPWALDKAGAVKIRRFGFPLVPDFGGTAHAYCGTTMDAALGDLLPWAHKPRLDEMLRAYIIKSRIRNAEDIMIARPYSPHLFRQGLLPGPALLLDVLEKKITSEEAKAAWKKHQTVQKDKARVEGKWLTAQELPCRLCTEHNGGEEVWHPITAFSAAWKEDELFTNVLRKGQDLVCFKCKHHYLKWEQRNDLVISCDCCGKVQARMKYDDAAKQLWETFSEKPIYCLSCQGRKVGRVASKLLFCHGECQRNLPEYQFVDAMLLEWNQEETELLAKCARCVLRGQNRAKQELMECQGCKEQLYIADFGPCVVKQYLADGLTKSGKHRWRCYNCQFPACKQCSATGRGDNRPLHAVPHNALSDDPIAPHGPGYYCETCRFPSCQCGARRATLHSKVRFKQYICEECTEKVASDDSTKICKSCNKTKQAKHFCTGKTGTRRRSTCMECEGRNKVCHRCTMSKSVAAFGILGTHRLTICIECEAAICHACSVQFRYGTEGHPILKGRGQDWLHPYCSDRCKYPVCQTQGCDAERPRKLSSYAFHNLPQWWCEEHF